ncbi:MAG: pyridoxamine 5'-phosphate oxidase family protein [Oscillospiraceae bacterium]|nr:pyridoxamine 5'-phosphate oxidase family protein [Oscillospiraceae bacterium]
MFRQMNRKKQQLTDEECREILKSELRGVLSLNGDDGYPYGLPTNHYYSEEDGKLYFHSGKKGYKIDAIRRDNRASFCVYDGGFRREGEWALNIRSVIVFGKIEFVDDQKEINRISALLSRKFTDDNEYIEKEIETYGAATLMFALVPEHMTGKMVNEA